MDNNTRFSKDEIKKLGSRLQSARVLTGLNREEFAEKNNLPYTSIKNWEIGRALPRQEGIIAILVALKECGVFASLEWILFGSGASPNYFETATYEKKDNCGDFVDEQVNLFKKAQRASGHNPIVVAVRDEEMAPLFNKGDLLGGVVVNPEMAKAKIHGSARNHRPWLVTTSDGLYSPVWLFSSGERWFINTGKHQELQECLSPAIAQIKWHYSVGEQR